MLVSRWHSHSGDPLWGFQWLAGVVMWVTLLISSSEFSWAINFSSSFEEEYKFNWGLRIILTKRMSLWLHNFIALLSLYPHKWPSFNLSLMWGRGGSIRTKCSLLTYVFTYEPDSLEAGGYFGSAIGLYCFTNNKQKTRLIMSIVLCLLCYLNNILKTKHFKKISHSYICLKFV